MPEVDAYNLSKLGKYAEDSGQTVTGTPSSQAFKMFTQAVGLVQNAVGYDEELVAFVNSTMWAAFQSSAEVSRQITVTDFRRGELSTQVRSINGIALLPVPDSRLKTAFTFKDGVTSSQEAGALSLPRTRKYRDAGAPAACGFFGQKKRKFGSLNPIEIPAPTPGSWIIGCTTIFSYATAWQTAYTPTCIEQAGPKAGRPCLGNERGSTMTTGKEIFDRAVRLLNYTDAYGEADGRIRAALYKRGLALVNQIYADLWNVEKGDRPFCPLSFLEEEVRLSSRLREDAMPYGVAMLLAQGRWTTAINRLWRRFITKACRSYQRRPPGCVAPGMALGGMYMRYPKSIAASFLSYPWIPWPAGWIGGSPVCHIRQETGRLPQCLVGAGRSAPRPDRMPAWKQHGRQTNLWDMIRKRWYWILERETGGKAGWESDWRERTPASRPALSLPTGTGIRANWETA